MELMELESQTVWQSRLTVPAELYRTFPLEEGWAKVALGVAAMDTHWFRRSPGAEEDGPVVQRQCGGYEFFFCAKPGGEAETPFGPDGPRRLAVEKHHSLLYRSGRSLDFLLDPAGQALVRVITAPPGSAALEVPEGFEARRLELRRDYRVDLPCPATVYFFPNGDSYQGPVSLPRG